jgi:glucuronoarabinoxylan endo-1,4-beta-xylanase
MMWAAIIDNRLAVMGANAWFYWQYYETTTNPASSNAPLWLPGGSPTYPTSLAIRAYVMGQYAKFIRPGYHRIDATHIPQSGVTVSAYNSGNNIVIVATNQNSTSVSQTFKLSILSPVITSATQTMASLAGVPIPTNSFTYTLPAYSVITFTGANPGLASYFTEIREVPTVEKGK